MPKIQFFIGTIIFFSTLHAGGPLGGWLTKQDNNNFSLERSELRKSFARQIGDNKQYFSDIRLITLLAEQLLPVEEPCNQISLLEHIDREYLLVIHNEKLRQHAVIQARALCFAWALTMISGTHTERQQEIARLLTQHIQDVRWLDSNTNSYRHDTELILAIRAADVAQVNALITNYYCDPSNSPLQRKECKRALQFAWSLAMPYPSDDYFMHNKLIIAQIIFDAWNRIAE